MMPVHVHVPHSRVRGNRESTSGFKANFSHYTDFLYELLSKTSIRCYSLLILVLAIYYTRYSVQLLIEPNLSRNILKRETCVLL